MPHFPIGVIIDSFRLPIPQAVQAAAEMGVDGIQVYATTGAMAPEEMTGEKRREFLKLCKDHHLVISALCGDMGHGFGDPENTKEAIRRITRML